MKLQRLLQIIAIALIAGLLVPLAAAPQDEHKGMNMKKSYTLHGKVEKVDATAGKLTVNHEKVEGWMDAMTMAYAVDKVEDLAKVKPGDQIEATVYQDEYKLYNIKVVAKK